MRALVVALAFVLAGWPSCQQQPAPKPIPSGPPPAPIVADAGDACAAACSAAIRDCGRPLISQETCVFRCTEGMAHLTGANPTCLTSVAVCNGKKGCL